MSILNVEHLTHGFGDRAIFNDVSFRLLKGEHIGLVGANGEGKSTFFNIVTGKLMPDEGKIEWAKNVRVGYLDQHSVLSQGMSIRDVLKSAFSYLFEMEERMNGICDSLGTASPEEMDTLMEELGTIQDTLTMHDFYVIDAKVEEVARALGLLDIGLERDVTDLSGGQRTKVLLGKLLLEKPDILLLDEPTNHLDMESIAWLETYLRNYSGAVIIVAHDRYFLDRVVTKIIELDMGHCTVFSGNYSAYSDKKAMLRDAAIRAYLNQQQEIRHQEAVIAKLKSFNREKSIKRAESREKMLDKIERLEKPTQANDSMDIRLEPDVVSGNDVLTVTDLSKSFDTQTLFTNVDFEIKRGERVAIIGNNGTGKTTLLKIINGIIPADSGQIRLGSKVHIGYYDQEHQVLHMDKTLFDELQDTYPDMNNTQIRNVLAAFLFTGDDVFKRIRDLSGGERGRVSLAKLMLSEANFLILDEPTNHLDIASKEILENALVHYTGTVLYVSHDRYFINKTATRILDLTMGTLINYIGNYDYYLEKKETQEKAYLASAAQAASRSAKSSGAGNTGTSSHLTAAAGANPTALSGNGTGTSAASSASAVTAAVQAAASASSGKLDWKQQKEEQTRLRKKQNELKRVEEEIHTLETRDQEIDALLCDETVFSDVPRLMELNKEKEELNAKLEGLYEKWEELAE